MLQTFDFEKLVNDIDELTHCSETIALALSEHATETAKQIRGFTAKISILAMEIKLLAGKMVDTQAFEVEQEFQRVHLNVKKFHRRRLARVE